MSSRFNQNTNFSKRRSGISTIWIRVFVVIVLVVIWILASIKILQAMNRARELSKDVITNAVSIATPKTLLVAKVRELSAENEMLRQQVLGNQITEDENSSLRQILNYPKTGRSEIIAQVIAKPSQNVYDRIIIDRGTRDGIEAGQKIIAGENSYIATIDSVTDTTAQATLISGSFWKGDAVITRLGITVPVEGKGSGNFELHIPRDMEVRDGDVMTLPGASDLIFGVIKSVQFDDRDPYQTVLARTPVNVQELKFVRVVR